MSQSSHKYLAVILSALIPFFVIGSITSFTNTGTALGFIILGTFYYFLSKKSVLNTTYLVSTIILATFLIIRSNALTTFFNVSLLIYLLSFLTKDPIEENKASLVNLVLWPVLVIPDILQVKSRGFYDGFFKFLKQDNKKDEIQNQDKESWKIQMEEKAKKDNNLFFQVFISLVLIAIIIPILASINPIFADFINSMLGFSNLWDFLISSVNISQFYRILFFGLLLIIIPKVIISKNKEFILKKEDTESERILTIPKSVTIATILVFIVTQFQLYFLSQSYLEELGYSYSQLNNEIFVQLSIVTFIIFSLIYFERSQQKLAKILSYILIAESVILLSFAFKSDFDYVSNWGFTEKRLYGFAVIGWLFGLFSLLVLKISKLIEKKILLQSILILSASIFIVINIANFDWLIWNVNKTRETQGIEYDYLSRLSTDANNYKELYEITQTEEVDYSTAANVEWNIIKLQEKYENGIDIRHFNLSEYNQYLEIKDLDVMYPSGSVENN